MSNSRFVYVTYIRTTPCQADGDSRMERPASKLIEAVSRGWPMILGSLKSLLETGEPLEETRHWPKDM
jgi:hypothetical protein